MAHAQTPQGANKSSGGSAGSPNFSSEDNLKKLSELADKLTDIRNQKEALKESNRYTKTKGDKPVYGDYSKRPKKLFSHPKLDHVYGQIVFSPYNFSPMVLLLSNLCVEYFILISYIF